MNQKIQMYQDSEELELLGVIVYKKKIETTQKNQNNRTNKIQND